MSDLRGTYQRHGRQLAPHGGQIPYGGQLLSRRLPGLAGDARRFLAVIVDLVVALYGAVGIAGLAPETSPWWTLYALVPVVSFTNQCVLTLLFRGSVGKLLLGVRVMRAADAGRPGPVRLLRRWLAGLCWLPLQPWYWLRENFGGSTRNSVRESWTGELYDTDIAGVRSVRRKDLAVWQRDH
ncbi:MULTISPECIES: RDD family protein [unclassified Streptomyces]|uniref:RDD family protein n=1 Tax=unclassified Streptomyces TaxID=2593676 RepID=UPI00332AFC81